MVEEGQKMVTHHRAPRNDLKIRPRAVQGLEQDKR